MSRGFGEAGGGGRFVSEKDKKDKKDIKPS
jgi:hypothetical protein